MDAGAADAKLQVFSFSHLTKPDKGDQGATLDRFQGRNFTSSQKEFNKSRMQMRRGLSGRAVEVFPTPAFTGIPFKAPVLEQQWQNWYWFECGRGFGEKQAEIENECELHDSQPPSSLLLFSALSPTSSPMSPSLSVALSPSLSRGFDSNWPWRP